MPAIALAVIFTLYILGCKNVMFAKSLDAGINDLLAYFTLHEK